MSSKRLLQPLTFAASATVVLAFALMDSYDLVTRQEIGLVAWWTVGLGVAFGVLRPWRFGRWPWASVGTLALLALWITISLGWTESSERTVAELARAVTYLGLLVLTILAVRRSTSRAAIGGAAVAAAAICILAFVDRLTGSTLTSDAIVNKAGASRLSYPLDYWNAMGTWAAMTLGLVLAASVHERKFWLRGIALGVIPIVAATAYLTYSRTSIASILLAIAVVAIGSRSRWTAFAHIVVAGSASAVVLLTIRSHSDIADGVGTSGSGAVALVAALAVLICGAVGMGLTPTGLDKLRLPTVPGRIIGALVTLAIVIAGTAFVVGNADTIRDQFENRNVSATAPVDLDNHLTSLNGNRVNLWKSALKAFESEPATGLGAGTFELYWNRDARDPEFVKDAHSIYLEALAELGWPGLLFVLLFVVALIATTIASRLRATPRRRDSGARLGAVAVVAVFALSAGVDWMWESTAVTALALIVAGAAASGLTRERRDISIPWRVGVACVAVLACLIELPGLISTSEVRSSQEAMRRGQIDAALADARDARSSAPWASSPVIQLGLIAEATGNYEVAQRLMQDAVERDPWDFRPWVLLARISAENGDVGQARDAYRRATKLRPLSVLFPRPPVSANPTTPRTN